MLEYVPASFKVVRHVRPKLACAHCDHIAQVDAPPRPIPRGIAGPALLAHMLVGKFCDHLPLYRQSAIYARSGLDLDRALLAEWVGHCHELLSPLVETIRRYVLGGPKVHADDTLIFGSRQAAGCRLVKAITINVGEGGDIRISDQLFLLKSLPLPMKPKSLGQLSKECHLPPSAPRNWQLPIEPRAIIAKQPSKGAIFRANELKA